MRENNIHNDEQDVFSQLVKQKLENHQIQPDDDLWKGIRDKMNVEKRRSIPLWYWISGGIAAAIALLLFLHPISMTDTHLQNTITKTEQPKNKQYKTTEPKQTAVLSEQPASDTDTKTAVKKSSSLAGMKNAAKPTLNNSNPIAVNSDIKNNSSKQAYSTGQTSESNNQTIVLPETKKKEFIAKNTVPTEKQNSEQITKTTSATNERGKNIAEITTLPDVSDYPTIPPADKKKKPKEKQRILLAAAFGTNSNFSSLNNSGFMASPSLNANANFVSSDALYLYGNDSKILNANDYTNAQHDPPLSFGITVEKSLDKNWGIESGLVYTYLKSTFTRTSNANYRGTLQLHYLGIPLNLRAKLWRKSNWDMYLSFGGMLEKGVRSVYRQEIDNISTTANTIVYSGIDGFQWSLNGAAGFDYKINRGISLFLEPKITYYLKNNQPASARTEHPLNIGIGGGIRIGL